MTSSQNKNLMQEKIGDIRNDLSGFTALAALSEKAKGVSLEKVDLDFQSCNFFEANMAAPFYAVMTRYYEQLNTVLLINIRTEIRIILQKNRFLCESGFSELHDLNHTTLPFKRFKLAASDQFSDYLDQYMHDRGIPKMSDGLAKKFRQSLFEIFQNAMQHSHSEQGIFVCGQFFPKQHRLDFTIADAGIGIRENVRRFWKNDKISSCQAITWALQETNTTKQNQPVGLGLKLIKDFLRLNESKMVIVSRYGYYEFSASGETCRKLPYDFSGTCVIIEINTNDTKSYALKSELKSSDIF
jgi:anti-sigma regulatory factor (Ser/Thr protein kinase)